MISSDHTLLTFSPLPTLSAPNRAAEGQTGDAVPSVPGGGQRPARRSFLHGLPLLRSPGDQAAAHLTLPPQRSSSAREKHAILRPTHKPHRVSLRRLAERNFFKVFYKKTRRGRNPGAF